MKLAHRNDIFRASALIPITQFFPATLITNNPTYLHLVAAAPVWLLPASLGFAVAVWLIDPWIKDSRLRQLWKWATDVFEVKHLHAQSSWQNWDSDGGVMPETDIGVRLRIKFRRRVKGHLSLRVFSCTGQGRTPFETVIKIGTVDAIAGETIDIPVVDLGIGEPGWDPQRRRGWGPDKSADFIGGSRNVAVLECRHGWLTQTHHIFVAMVSHVGKHQAPRIYVQDGDDDVFDISEHVRTGLWKYG
jgi:hypothetical protein